MNDSSSDSRRDRPQFSLRSLLLITAGVAVYIALAAAAVRNHGELLDAVMDAPGLYAIGCGCLALSGLCMMAVNIGLGHVGRIWSIGLLLAGIAYAAANIGVFVVTLLLDTSAIFERAYIISAGFVGPGVMILALIIVAGFCKRLGWLGAVGFAVWIGCIGFAHLWIIAAASASV